jgi:hypothetical protein
MLGLKGVLLKMKSRFMENQIGEKNQYVSTQGKLYLLGVSYYF